jgi:phosphopantetheine adenylyltransferase
LEDEFWEYSVLNIPECMVPPPAGANGSVSGNCHEITKLESVCPDCNISQRPLDHNRKYPFSIYRERSRCCSRFVSLFFKVTWIVGGTFDHLHPGHKILLSLTAYLPSRKLICGITGLSLIPHWLTADDALLKNKKFAEVLESISVRTENVRKFLTLIARNLELELVPIQDVYGPTAYDPEISGLVISEETRAGAHSIAELRKEKGLQTLDVFVIDVIGDDGGKVGVEKMAEEKMSSTKIRERLVQKQ